LHFRVQRDERGVLGGGGFAISGLPSAVKSG